MTELNVMIDIETLSTNKDAAIVAIGAASFKNGSVTSTAGWRIDPRYIYGHIDPKTVGWWMRQSDAARNAVFGGKDTPFAAATGLGNFIGAAGGHDCLVWANSPTFDLVILQHWWENMPHRAGRDATASMRGALWPVSYKNERDYRTVADIGKRLGIATDDLRAGAVLHDPVTDAAIQARIVMRILGTLGRNDL